MDDAIRHRFTQPVGAAYMVAMRSQATLLEHACRATPIDFDSFMTATLPVGRNAIPALLVAWEQRGILTPELLRVILPMAWGMPEFPERAIDSAVSVMWFRRARFVHDEWHTQPTAPLHIYRGINAPVRSKLIRRMAWTCDIAVAEWFAAARFAERGAVYSALIPPTGVLGLFYARDNEPELVVDPSHLLNMQRVPAQSSPATSGGLGRVGR